MFLMFDHYSLSSLSVIRSHVSFTDSEFCSIYFTLFTLRACNVLRCRKVSLSVLLFFFRCIKGKAAKVCMDGGAWLLTYPRLWGDRVERPRA